jgi:hypothetical protein
MPEIESGVWSKMNEGSEAQSPKNPKGLIACFIAPLVLLLVYVALGWFDKTTELTPSHDNVLQYCFIVAGVGGLVCCGLSFLQARGMAAWRRIGIACSLLIVGFLAVFLVSYRSSDIIEGRIDFPPSTTRTYPGLLVIWRAYQTHGKGQSWNIQTTPIWSNLDVTKTDYEFMLAHRGPGDHGSNPDEISSHGFFCAQVTIQQSGNALRIMHAGSQKLPAGTVIVCPISPSQTSSRQP